MKLKSVQICNFRGIKDITLDIDDKVTALIGRNGVGKTSFLDALKIFIKKTSVNTNDFYKYLNDNTEESSNEISIKITLDLTSAHPKELKAYPFLIIYKTLTIKFVTTKTIKPKYIWSGFMNSDFKKYFDTTAPQTKQNHYRKLYEKPSYAKFFGDNNLNENSDDFTVIDDILYKYQKLHLPTTKADYIDPNFKFTINDLLSVTYIRASNTAIVGKDDDNYSDISAINTLISEHWEIQHHNQLADLKNTFTDDVNKLIKRTKYGIAIYDQIKKNIANLVAGININYKRQPAEQQINTPEFTSSIIENKLTLNINEMGQGFQRSYVIATLQALTGSSSTSKNRNKKLQILMIDEPELFQHPNQQKHFCNILNEYAEPGKQVIFSTHSPHFVRLENIDGIRIVIKNDNKIEITNSKIDKILSAIHKNEGKEGYIDRLESFISWLNNNASSTIVEGFFSNAVVLVEGAHDVTALKFIYDRFHNKENETRHAKNITIIPCLGKSKINKFAIMFDKFRIPAYLIWDSDCKHSQESSRLLDLVGYVELSNTNIGIQEKNFSCFNTNMSDYIENTAKQLIKKYPKKKKIIELNKILNQWKAQKFVSNEVLSKILECDPNALDKLKEISNLISKFPPKNYMPFRYP